MPSAMASSLHRVLLIAVVAAAAAIDGVRGSAMVTGTVFCDQCKDGKISLFDYPLSGVKVAMACRGSDGTVTTVREETTNLFGGYTMKFDGAPDFSSCYTQVAITEHRSTGCAAAAGPAKSPRLIFSMFEMELYSVDPLLSQPVQPTFFCHNSHSPALPPPITTVPARPPPIPVPSQQPPLTPYRCPPLPPAFKLPPMPPVPFFEASACSYQYWLMPEYKCYWKVVHPDMKVALIFGPSAARIYGMEMTLQVGLQGRGDLYRTLLREGITALLNSYNSFYFPYNPFRVVESLNKALMGSPRSILRTARRFMKANSGHDQVTCKFKAC
ncbi:hypothetical protein Nepgr_025503 [Nepenthes gracilis]|uniref:Pollen Ole e 1 allergen and extensin family protein n=1 Tax=Nepenthes gracilis TaxID=150966 RepID=A0AAD3T588_NEPGR|nr:hypothetical protein Nepgr_025503 [Nepenthes gracilis]